MKDLFLIAASLSMFLDWLAVWRGWRRTGYIAKPLTILLLFSWFFLQTHLRGAFSWFGIGLLFSLAGDIFLMLSPGFFIVGLASFGLVHMAYFVGFIHPLQFANLWGACVLAVILGMTTYFLMVRITRSQVNLGLKKLVNPTLVYAFFINLMLLSTLLTFFRPNWKIGNAMLVSLGALLFYISDLTNAWIRFVNPVRSGRVLVMMSYHLGQFILIISVVLHFSSSPGV